MNMDPRGPRSVQARRSGLRGEDDHLDPTRGVAASAPGRRSGRSASRSRPRRPCGFRTSRSSRSGTWPTRYLRTASACSWVRICARSWSPVVVGERGDDHLGPGPLRLGEPGGHVVELLPTRAVRTDRPGSKRSVGRQGPAVALGSRLEEDPLAVVKPLVVEVARQGPGPLLRPPDSGRGHRSPWFRACSGRSSSDTPGRPSRACPRLPFPSRIEVAMVLTLCPGRCSAASGHGVDPAQRGRVACFIRSDSSGVACDGDRRRGRRSTRGIGSTRDDLDHLGPDQAGRHDPGRGVEP